MCARFDIERDPDEIAFERLSAKHSTLEDHIKHRESGDRLVVSSRPVLPEGATTKLFSRSMSAIPVFSENTEAKPGPAKSEALIDGGKGVYSFEELAKNAKKYDVAKAEVSKSVLDDSIGTIKTASSRVKRSAQKAIGTLHETMVEAPLEDGVTTDDDLDQFDSGMKRGARVAASPSHAQQKTSRFLNSRANKIQAKVQRLEKKSAQAFKRGELKRSARYLGKADRLKRPKRAKVSSLIGKATSKRALIIVGSLAAAGLLAFTILMSLMTGIGAMMARNQSFGNLSVSELRIATFFMSNGLDAQHTAAILGNIRVEVGGEIGDEFDITQTQDGHICLAPNYSNCGRSGTAHGLFQLECDGRFQALNNYAAKSNRTWKDLSVQCEYMLFEDMPYQFEHHSRQLTYYSNILGPSYDGIAGVGYYMSFNDWKAITDLDWATESFCRIVERAGKPWMDRRKSYAQQYYAMLTAAPSTDGATSVQRAYQELGKPYVWGASGPDSYDCSGLVYYCISGKVGGHPETTYTLYNKSQIISGAEAQPGDLVHLYFKGGSPSHVGLYIGGGKMIHAPHSGDVVKISYVPQGAVYGRFMG